MTLNSNGCGDLGCNRTEVEQIFSSASTSSVDCSVMDTNRSAYTFELNFQVNCDIRNKTTDINENLTTFMQNPCSGTCYTENSTKTGCICGYDGRFYCAPNKSSGLFDDFWNVCASNNNTIDQKTNLLWNYVFQHYVDILTAPYCADDVFPEINPPNLDYLIDEYSEILVPVLTFFSLLLIN